MTNEEVIKEIRNLSNLFVMNSKPCKAKAGKEQPFRSGTEPFIQVNKIEIMFEPAILKAFDKAIEALEKQIPKKPNITSMKLIGGEVLAHYNVCPICDEVIMSGYPCKCGQLIDWSDDNDE